MLFLPVGMLFLGILFILQHPTLCFIHSTLFYTLIVFLVFADAVLTPWDAISQDLIHPSTPNSNVTSMKAFFIDLRQKASLSPLLL